MTLNHAYITSDTILAAYLVSIGFELREIRYDDSQNRRQNGNFIFNQSEELQTSVNKFLRTEAPGDIVKYEHAKKNLLDRVMRGLP